MKSKNVLVAGSALAVLAFASTPVLAKAASHKKPAAADQTIQLRDEIDALKAEVQDLSARLSAQQQAQDQAVAAAQAAQAQADAAKAQAVAAQAKLAEEDSKILTIPVQVEKAAKANAPKPGWWNDTKIGATMFADASTISNKNSAGKTAQSGTDYDIKRLYLVVDKKINETYSFNVTTDFTFDSNATSPSGASAPTANEAGGANTASGIKSTQLYFKKAYLQAHYSDAFTVRLGAADLPWIPYDESIYGYRWVEQTLIDRTKFGTSSDWGVHVLGSLANKMINYQFSVVDGEGYKQPSLGNVNRTNSVDVEGRINLVYKNFNLAVGGYDGKLGNAVSGVTTYNTAERFDLLAAYTDKKVRLGFEYLYARYWKDVKQSNPAKTNSSEGYSVFGSYNFTTKVALFGKYEYLKPLETTAPTFNDNYFNVGLSYKPVGPVDFALVYKREDVNNGSLSTANGVIGIPTGGATGRGTYDEFGLFTQVKF